MSSLFEMTAEYQNILGLLEDYEVEPSDELVRALSGLEANIEKKADGYCSIIRELQNRVEVCEKEVARLEARANQFARKAEWLRGRLLLAMQAIKAEKITTATNTISIVKNGGQLPLQLIGPVPEEYQIKQEVVSNNMLAIREKLEAGEQLPFAVLKPRGVHLRIKG